MKLVWLSDTHLNFISEEQTREFVKTVACCDPDVVIISGDLADGRTFSSRIKLLSEIGCSIYFVLGNHDFYHSSINAMRVKAKIIQEEYANLFYLPTQGVVQLTPDVALVGHDGWADGRNGNPFSLVELNDFYLIGGLTYLNYRERREAIAMLAAAASGYFSKVLPLAASSNKKVILVTHVPPFAEASFHRGSLSSPDFQPFYSSKIIGDTITNVMKDYPDCHLTVLCGHTHGVCRYAQSSNIEVRSEAAEYGNPRIADILEIANNSEDRR